MRKIHEVLRLNFEHGRSKRQIARIINVLPITVSDYLARAKLAGLASPLPPESDDASLEKLLFPLSRSFKFSRERKAIQEYQAREEFRLPLDTSPPFPTMPYRCLLTSERSERAVA